MIDIKKWVLDIQSKIAAAFGARVLFIGYQGSYRRGEADENSDIDMVVILDSLKSEDLKIYKAIVKTMPYTEKACGFISGRAEISNWSKWELFQLYNDTKAVYGDLKELIPQIGVDDAKMAVKTGCQNIYHMAVHSFMYSGNLAEVLVELYKGVFFILQADYYAKTGEYVLSKKELFNRLSGRPKEIMGVCIDRKNIKNSTIGEAETYCSLLIEFTSGGICGKI